MYNHVILGGTFDHFHKGHQALIDKAFSVGNQVTIGLAQKNLYKNKFLAESIESYENRRQSLVDYLRQKSVIDQADIIPIADIFGPSIVDPSIEAVIASKETYQNTLLINQNRSELNFPALKIFIVDDVLADDGKLLTSERIRMGEIDREGRVYIDVFNVGNRHACSLRLPITMREEMRKPLGKVYKNVGAIFKSPFQPVMIISVGDIISQSLEEYGIQPDVKIIDYKSRRKLISFARPRLAKLKKYRNQSGTIIKEAVKAIQSALKKPAKQTVVIDGEEDLLALPAILLSPLNSLVLYGQFDLGIVAVTVTEEKKLHVINILNKFTS